MLRMLATILALTLAWSAAAQPVVVSSYRPPETVQRVVVPVNPAEDRL